jgi:methylated-DNA-[protein]-cysteine S-methyltransferase
VTTMHRTKTTVYWTIESPVGELLLAGDGTRLQRLHFHDSERRARIDPAWERSAEPFDELCAQLDQYFAGERREFDVPLDPAGGTEFERRVWAALREIPYGETEAYGELADRIGHPGRARAVGAANGRNPIAIVIPCHRVIGADGRLVGYGGGLPRKRRLLELEGRPSQLDLESFTEA